jgi:hypothetical protein
VPIVDDPAVNVESNRDCPFKSVLIDVVASTPLTVDDRVPTDPVRVLVVDDAILAIAAADRDSGPVNVVVPLRVDGPLVVSPPVMVVVARVALEVAVSAPVVNEPKRPVLAVRDDMSADSAENELAKKLVDVALVNIVELLFVVSTEPFQYKLPPRL